MIEAASTSETSVNFYQTTWRYNPEDRHLQISSKFMSDFRDDTYRQTEIMSPIMLSFYSPHANNTLKTI
jgi:hypothetical protein